MPLTPATSAAPTSEPFNFSALRPVGDTFDLNSLAVDSRGLVLLSDTRLVVYVQSTNLLTEFSMMNGDPTTLTPTGATVSIPYLTLGSLTYDPTNFRIYSTAVIEGLLIYIDLAGPTLAGASLNPTTAPIPGTWAVGVTQDGTTIYQSTFASTSRVSTYTFGVPGDITTLVFQQQNNYRLGNQLGAIMISPDMRRLIMTTLVAPNNFGYADFRAPNELVTAGVLAPDPAAPSRLYNYYPFQGPLNFSSSSRDGAYMFHITNPGRLTRFNMV